MQYHIYAFLLSMQFNNQNKKNSYPIIKLLQYILVISVIDSYTINAT